MNNKRMIFQNSNKKQFAIIFFTAFMGVAVAQASAQDVTAIRPTKLICTVSQIQGGPPSPGMGMPHDLPVQQIVTTQEGSSNWYDSKATVNYSMDAGNNEIVTFTALGRFQEQSPQPGAVPSNSQITFTVSDSLTGQSFQTAVNAQAAIQAPPLPPAQVLNMHTVSLTTSDGTSTRFGCSFE